MDCSISGRTVFQISYSIHWNKEMAKNAKSLDALLSFVFYLISQGMQWPLQPFNLYLNSLSINQIDLHELKIPFNTDR